MLGRSVVDEAATLLAMSLWYDRIGIRKDHMVKSAVCRAAPVSSQTRKSCPFVQMGMLFVRDRGGISHSPLEFVAPEDIAAAAAALYMYLREEMLF
jgi:hypothetical protein